MNGIISPTFGRRAVLGGAAAAAAGSLIYPVRGTFAAGEAPVKIGMVDSETGVYAADGASEIMGARLALDQVNKAGGILGRPVELLVEDDAASPGLAVTKARKLVSSDKVNFLMGTISSAVSLSVSHTAEELGILFVVTGGHSDPITGTDCRWTTFRTCSNTWMLASGNFKLLFDKFGKNWYFITPDYAYGHSVADDYTKLLQDAGGKLLGNALAPLGTTDFSSYLIQARLAKPDVLMFLTAGDDLVNSLKQGVQFGLDKQMAFAGPYIEVEDLMAMPQAARIGWWSVEWWWDQPKQPHVAEFVAAYKTMSGGKVPTARSWFGFVSLHSIALAANQAKSIESLKVCKAMEGLVLPPEVALAPNNPFYRAEDHQLMLSEFVGYVLTDGVYPNLFQVTNIVPGTTIALPPGQEGCKMVYPS